MARYKNRLVTLDKVTKWNLAVNEECLMCGNSNDVTP